MPINIKRDVVKEIMIVRPNVISIDYKTVQATWYVWLTGLCNSGIVGLLHMLYLMALIMR